jgi:hypothetical protein
MVVRDVLVPGEDGSVPAGAHSTDQIPLYDGLTPLGSDVTAADVTRYFKEDPLGEGSGMREYVPLAGLTIVRDRYDVPHIFGKTRADAEFGAGWVAAEDRGLLLQFIRSAGALAALDAPGIDAFSVAAAGQQFDESPATRKFLASELALASAEGPDAANLAGEAILKAAWSGLVEADLSPVLGPLWSEIPGDGMSYLVEDLSDLLHLPQRAHYSRVYCGDGSLAACRASLWAAIQSAVNGLRHSQGTDMAAWRQQPAAITFLPGVLGRTIRYTNRPTFQQVVWFGR